MRIAKSIACMFALAISAIVCKESNAQGVCPQCGVVHSYQAPAASGLQAQAQAEAQQMASRQFKGHVQGVVSGASFSGVGWSPTSSSPNTCTPGNGMTLVADAVARGADGWYRVRYWR